MARAMTRETGRRVEGDGDGEGARGEGERVKRCARDYSSERLTVRDAR